MNEVTFEELTKSISNTMKYTANTPQEAGRGLRRFGKWLEDFSQLSDEVKAQFWIDAFRNPENKDACEAFARRHPDCSMNAFIPK